MAKMLHVTCYVLSDAGMDVQTDKWTERRDFQNIILDNLNEDNVKVSYCHVKCKFYKDVPFCPIRFVYYCFGMNYTMGNIGSQ